MQETHMFKLALASSTLLFLSGCGVTDYIRDNFNGDAQVYYPANDSKNDPSKSDSKGMMKPYTINGKAYHLTVVEVGETANGIASWYGPGFYGKKANNGETRDQDRLTVAYKTLSMNMILKVANLNSNRQVIVHVNDRGPPACNRIIDLFKGAAGKTNMIHAGTAPVRPEVIDFGNKNLDNEVVRSSVNYGSGGAISGGGNAYEGGNSTVQIGAFRSRFGVEIIMSKYKTHRSHSLTTRISSVNGLDRVFLTGFRSEDEAEDFASSGTFAGAFVVRE